MDYDSLPGLVGIYLEDSYVLGILESSKQVVFRIDAVLTPEHPAHHAPDPERLLLRARKSRLSRSQRRHMAQPKQLPLHRRFR
jgi:hypothetical protein